LSNLVVVVVIVVAGVLLTAAAVLQDVGLALALSITYGIVIDEAVVATGGNVVVAHRSFGGPEFGEVQRD
jgi:hypothetical protein